MIADGIDLCEQKRVAKATSEANLSFETIARQWHASNKKCSESHSEKVLKSLESHVIAIDEMK